MGDVNVHSSIRAQWISAIRFCFFAIMPVGGLLHIFAVRLWVALAFSPIVLFTASLSLSNLGSSLSEYELSDSHIKKVVLGKVGGVLPYDEVEKVNFRKDRWCYVKGNKQTFFFTPDMEGFDECMAYLGDRLKVPKLGSNDPDPPNSA